MKLDVHYDFLPKKYTVNASVVMDHFGIDFEQGRHVIAEGLDLPLQDGDVVLFTGPSGSGKSSLMRATAEQLANTGVETERPCGCFAPDPRPQHSVLSTAPPETLTPRPCVESQSWSTAPQDSRVASPPRMQMSVRCRGKLRSSVTFNLPG